MPDSDPLAQAVEALEASQRERDQEHEAETKRSNEAIATIKSLIASRSPKPPPPDPEPKRSVRTLMLDLMAEGDRDWSVNEMLAEYDARGTPVHGIDPSNALRAALADAKKDGSIVWTSRGRYKHGKYGAPEGGSEELS